MATCTIRTLLGTNKDLAIDRAGSRSSSCSTSAIPSAHDQPIRLRQRSGSLFAFSACFQLRSFEDNEPINGRYR